MAKKADLKKSSKNLDAVMTELMAGLKRTQDGWANIATGLGVEDRDSRMTAQIIKTTLTVPRIESLYQADDMAAKVVDLLPQEMFREGYELKIEGDEDKSKAKIIKEKLKFHKINEKLEESFNLARLYGGSAVLKGIPSPQASSPRRVQSFTVLDRTMLLGDSATVIKDLKNPDFGLPRVYRINESDAKQNNLPINRSRLIFFHGVSLPKKLMAENEYWGQSVLIRLHNVLRNFNTGYDSMATILVDFTQAVFKMKGLNDILKAGAEGETLVRTRLRLITFLKSVVNAIVIQDDEEYDKKTTAVGPLDKLLDKLNNRLVAATDGIPHTLLLGESPSGLGASGNSEITNWYARVKSEQKTKAEPPLREIIDIFMLQAFNEIPSYEIIWNPLWQMDAKDEAEINKNQSEADGNNVDRGILRPQEVRNSRFGPEGSLKTTIDDEPEIELGKIKPEKEE